MGRAKAVLLAASLFVSGAYAYVWPSPYDFLEDALSLVWTHAVSHLLGSFLVGRPPQSG